LRYQVDLSSHIIDKKNETDENENEEGHLIVGWCGKDGQGEKYSPVSTLFWASEGEII